MSTTRILRVHLTPEDEARVRALAAASRTPMERIALVALRAMLYHEEWCNLRSQNARDSGDPEE